MLWVLLTLTLGDYRGAWLPAVGTVGGGVGDWVGQERGGVAVVVEVG